MIYFLKRGVLTSGCKCNFSSADCYSKELLLDAIKLVLEKNKISTSMLQRNFCIGYSQACALLDLMEEKGIISVGNGTKPRKVILSHDNITKILNEI